MIPKYERDAEVLFRGHHYTAEFALDRETTFHRAEVDAMGRYLTQPEEVTREAYVAAQVAWAAERFGEAGWPAEEVEEWLHGLEEYAQEQLRYEADQDDYEFRRWG